MRVTSKKKRPAEGRVEKRDSSVTSEMSTASEASVSPHSGVTAALNSAELCELQDLLRQKRSQLELQEDLSTTGSLLGDADIQETTADLACVYFRRVQKTVFFCDGWTYNTAALLTFV